MALPFARSSRPHPPGLLAPVSVPDPAAVTAEPAAPAAAAPALSDEIAVVLLADIAPAWRWWGWWRIARGAQSLRGTPGLRFSKALGSGHEGGFGLRPSASMQGLFALFDSGAAADAFLAASPALRAFRARSAELCVLKLQPWSSRGQWSGQAIVPSAQVPSAGAAQQPVVALTRASIRWRRTAAFWSKAPAAQAALANAPGCRLAVGLGEAPLLRQCTLSLWDSVEAMDAYARSGAHLDAIRAAGREGYFSESMFVRFVPLSIQGRWKGTRHG